MPSVIRRTRSVLHDAVRRGSESRLPASLWRRTIYGASMTDVQLVFTTLPTADAAVALARTLVEERLAACGNILPAVRSIYRWEGTLQDENEVLLLLKTRSEQFERLKARILELHPYEVPEVLAIPVEAGHRGYLDWIAATTKSPDRNEEF